VLHARILKNVRITYLRRKIESEMTKPCSTTFEVIEGRGFSFDMTIHIRAQRRSETKRSVDRVSGMSCGKVLITADD